MAMLPDDSGLMVVQSQGGEHHDVLSLGAADDWTYDGTPKRGSQKGGIPNHDETGKKRTTPRKDLLPLVLKAGSSHTSGMTKCH